MNSYYSDVDNKPPEMIVISGRDGTRQVAKDESQPDYSPRLPAQSVAQTLQAMLSTPAPVPQREPAAMKRERIEGANEKSTPVLRAVASAIRSVKYLALVVVLGLVLYVAIPSLSGVVVTAITIIVMAVVMLVFDSLEYRHSQAGVERLRTNVDHKLETLHEVNRHDETMEAIRGDIEIKLKVLDLAAGNRQIASDRGQQKLLRGDK